MKVFILLIGIFALSAEKGYACYCVKPYAPEALAQAQAVFVGQVIDITDPRSILSEDPASERLFTVKFRVERGWKGTPFSGEVSVLSAQGNGACTHPPVSLGERYLVYAESAGGWPMITSCSRTVLLTDPITQVETLTLVANNWGSNWDLDSDAPTTRMQLTVADQNADADLRLLESLLFPSLTTTYRRARKPAEKLEFMNFLEPTIKR